MTARQSSLLALLRLVSAPEVAVDNHGQTLQAPPRPCNMRIIEATAVSTDELAAELAASSVPIVVRDRADWQQSSSFANLLEYHSFIQLKVVRNEKVTNNFQQTAYTTSVGEWAQLVRSGGAPRGDYVFSNVDNTSLATAMPDLCDFFAMVACRWKPELCKAPRAARGTMSLIFGGDGSANGFHEHGPALNSLLAGHKDWKVTRGDKKWMCTQGVGDLVWVPNGLRHSTKNRGREVVALTTLFDDPATSALHEAAKKGLVPEVQALLKAGAAREYRDSADYTALHAAAKLGQAEAVKALCDGGVSVNAKGDDVTALHHAAFYGHPATVQALLDAGAAVGASNSEGHTPLHYAAANGHEEVARLLLVAGAPAGAMGADGASAFAFAANNGHVETARVLLKATAASGVLPADSNKDCKAWATAGECEKRGEFMLQACARTCSES